MQYDCEKQGKSGADGFRWQSVLHPRFAHRLHFVLLNITKALSWEEVMFERCEGERVLSDLEWQFGLLPRDVTVIMNAECADRLSFLCDEGKAPQHGGDLYRLLYDFVRHTRVSGTVLNVVAAHSLEVLEGGKFTGNELGDFLYAFSCCTLKDTCKRKDWAELEPLVWEMLGRKENMCRGSLVRGALGAHRILAFDVSPLVDSLCSKYGDKLHELMSSELCALLELVRYRLSTSMLYIYIFRECCARICHFDADLCHWLLKLIRRYPPSDPDTLGSALMAFDRKLANGVERLTNEALSNAALAFLTCKRPAMALDFECEFKKRWRSLQVDEFIAIVHYIAKYCSAKSLYAHLMEEYMKHNWDVLARNHVVSLLQSLVTLAPANVDSATRAALLLQDRVGVLIKQRQMSYTTAIAAIVSLQKLNVCSQSVCDKLMELVIRHFWALCAEHVCALLGAVAGLEYRDSYATILFHELMYYPWPKLKLNHSAELLCKACVELRIAPNSLLRMVVSVVYNAFVVFLQSSEESFPPQITAYLVRLSVLRFPYPKLFQHVSAYFDRESKKLWTILKVEDAVDAVWALTVQGACPHWALMTLMRLYPGAIGLLPMINIYRLHQLLIAATFKNRQPGLDIAALNTLRSRMGVDLQRPASDIGSITDLQELLKPDCVRFDMLTAEWFRISAAIIVDSSGVPHSWPATLLEPSSADLCKLKALALTPIAIMALDETCFFVNSSEPLGPAYLLRYCLSLLGWKVALVRLSELSVAPDHQSFLVELLHSVGATQLHT